MTAFAVILAMRARADLGNDHVDGTLPTQPGDVSAKSGGSQ
jgi:multicomponent K+:H+ antiporter subunit C